MFKNEVCSAHGFMASMRRSNKTALRSLAAGYRRSLHQHKESKPSSSSNQVQKEGMAVGEVVVSLEIATVELCREAMQQRDKWRKCGHATQALATEFKNRICTAHVFMASMRRSNKTALRGLAAGSGEVCTSTRKISQDRIHKPLVLAVIQSRFRIVLLLPGPLHRQRRVRGRGTGG